MKSRTTWKPKVLPPSWGKIQDYDRGWIAALIDSEGSLCIRKLKNGGLYPNLQIWNTDRRFLEHAQRIIGGTLCEVKPSNSLSKKRVYQLSLYQTLLMWLLPQVELIVKAKRKRQVLKLLKEKGVTSWESGLDVQTQREALEV
ncbi:MAG TPA: hypothetical protein VFE98_09800 [Candidatus Bathyarchaeia archaeon]|nr:hypothetical protein [Candidatus Bathyarchaeia archaeon]